MGMTKTETAKPATMSVIKISAAELVPGDNDNGEIIATVDVQGAITYLTYRDDDTRLRVRSADVYAVKRQGGVSTVKEGRGEAEQLTPAEILAIEAEIGDQRERELQRELRRIR